MRADFDAGFESSTVDAVAITHLFVELEDLRNCAAKPGDGGRRSPAVWPFVLGSRSYRVGVNDV
jgi:hypothetical protein